MILKTKKRVVLLSVFLCLGCLFASFSTILIIKVNSIRKNVENHVADINTLSRLEAETYLIINAIEKDTVKELLQRTIQLLTFPDVPAEIEFSGLNSFIKNNDNVSDKYLLKGELFLITKSCQYAIGDHRKQLRLNSEKLSDYWNYTHILLILASIALLTFPIVIYKCLKEKM